MSDNVIQVEDLGYTYTRGRQAKEALRGLSFSVRHGEIVGLLGPNGAGKTTAVKILTTILRPGRGRALVCGHDVSRDPLSVRRQLAAVLQESAVETLLSTEDNLMLYGRLHGLDRAETRRRMDEVVELMELRAQLPQRAQELSGGYKRRLQVAKALMVDTPVLFLDEATTGMDLLAKGCTLDFHPSRFPVGACAQTGLAKAGVLVGKLDAAPRFELVVRRSFADYLVRWIMHSAAPHGLDLRIA